MNRLLLFLALMLPMFAGAQPAPVGMFTPGSGGSGSGAGSITNLSPYSATLYTTSLAVTNSTNFSRVFNMFQSSVSSNMTASTSTGGITVTNDGYYRLDLNVVFRHNTNQNSANTVTATNIFAISTNLGSVGTNLTQIVGILSTIRTNINHYNLSVGGLAYLPSNAVVAMSYYNIGASGTNDIAFEKAALSVMLVPGSTLGTGGSGLTDGDKGDVNVTSSASVFTVEGHSGAMVGVGAYTNRSGSSGGIVVEYSGATNVPGLWITADTTTAAMLSGLGYVAIGFANNRSIVIESNNNRVNWNVQPFGNLGLTNSYGWDNIYGSNGVFAKMHLPGLTPSKAVILNSAGMAASPSGTADATTYLRGDGSYATPPGGSATPGGTTAMLQVNMNGAFVGLTNVNADVTNGAIAIGTSIRPESSLQITGSQATIFLDSSVPLQRMAVRPTFVGTDATTGQHPWSLGVGGTGTVSMAHRSILVKPMLQVSAASNHMVALASSGTVTIYGTNQSYEINVTGSTTFADDTLLSNVVYNVRGSNASQTVSFPATWNWPSGVAPVLTNGSFRFHVCKDNDGTNAWVETQAGFLLSRTWGIELRTNGNIIYVSPTNHNTGIATNTTAQPIDFSDVVDSQSYNVANSLVTNISLWPTNLVTGRTIEIYFNTNAVTYDITVTNLAGNPVNWNFNIATNGSTSFTKTNTLRARVFLTPQTNGTISAEMGYYR